MKRGFTLIELLVVVAIIAILAAMLLPALNRARAAARTASCQQNLKNLSMSMNMYSSDYGGYLCWHRHRYMLGVNCNNYCWYELWTPYTDGSEVFHDPGRAPVTPWTIENCTADRRSAFWCDYVWNREVLFTGADHGASVQGVTTNRGVTIDMIPHPSSTVGLQCWRTTTWANFTMAMGTEGDTPFAMTADGAPKNGIIYARILGYHNVGINFLFVDGHVEWSAPDVARRDWYMGSSSRRWHRTSLDIRG